MLASRLAALEAWNCTMFSSSRLKACTSRTAEMPSCRSAFTDPISSRARRNALRAWPEKYMVMITISGATTRLIRV